ncbi:CoA-acylating methylmalonate-semialdehyde dehydrogenase [Stratiformator vulcanicus]|uniref:methylmalonate-semialdehyde dehydrogenase (CoA acylating) n=1 Tax=Stratiformator vulcanicus TaxID=2527980 RepID=A0A517R311_9PLAN|nr:CoA-acylating methylmalonate-semialdehyde dehydrogenase [Stratiformator vulcanicus]QDT38254.1 Methylmalonate-semialdehyde dehydrogenase [acylating] [Stratiformator vulcanicus]
MSTVMPAGSAPAATSESIGHYLGGDRVTNFGSGASIDVTSPLDGSALGTLVAATADDVDRAVATASEAFKLWGATPLKDRVQPLFRFKQLVEENIDELAAIVTAENGKTIAESEAGIRKGLEVVEYATSLPSLMRGGLLEVSRGVDCFERRDPLGVVAGITPFNFPAMVPMWMYPIAIACGNTFILKPSEQVPLTQLRMAELFKDAGLPDGVFNVVQGDRGTVEALLDHEGIAAAAFVGSTKVAKAVYDRGSNAGKRVLALGGAKNHLVVVPDADPDITARNVVSSATGCAGQRCMAASVLITVGDCDSILDKIAETMDRIVPGENMGAIINSAAKERIEGYISRAESDGATLKLDGRGATVAGKEGGHYVGATLIEGVDREHPAACDEIFGPVLTVLRVDTLDEALEIENSNPYGNAASIYTTSGATARYFEERASAGMIGINIGVPVPREPFSFGGWNDSKFGAGDITGDDGFAFWSKRKKITEKWSASGAKNWMS